MKIIKRTKDHITIVVSDQEINYLHNGLYMYYRQLQENQYITTQDKEIMLSEVDNIINLFNILV